MPAEDIADGHEDSATELDLTLKVLVEQVRPLALTARPTRNNQTGTADPQPSM